MYIKSWHIANIIFMCIATEAYSAKSSAIGLFCQSQGKAKAQIRFCCAMAGAQFFNMTLIPVTPIMSFVCKLTVRTVVCMKNLISRQAEPNRQG